MTLQACRICLETNSKLYPTNKYKLNIMYSELVGIVSNELMTICVQCSFMLIKFYEFKLKSLRSHELLNVALAGKEITLQIIESIDRKLHKIESSLSIKNNKPDCYDYMLEEEAKVFIETSIKTEINNDFYNDNENHYDIENSVDDNYVSDNDYTNNLSNISNKEVRNKSDSRNVITLKKSNKNMRIENENLDNGINDTNKDKLSNNDKDLSDNDSDWNEDLAKIKSKNKVINEVKTKKAGILIKLIAENFHVKYLDSNEQVLEFEKRKGSDNYLQSDYKCDKCYRGFREERTFNDHMLKHDKKSGAYACEVCQLRFTSDRLLSRHFAYHTCLYSCRTCEFITQFKYSAQLHIKSHRGVIYTCKYCKMEFNWYTSCLSHERIKHPSNSVCQFCGYSFIGEKGLRNHIKKGHKHEDLQLPENAPYCQTCDIKFANTTALDTHYYVSLKHSSDKKLKRNDPSSLERKLNKYKSTRSNIIDERKQVTCEICNLKLKSFSRYRFHFLKCHPNKQRTQFPKLAKLKLCDVCGASFSCNAILQDHKRIHTGLLKQCDVCKKAYKTISSLKLHMKTHAGNKYPCPTCGKIFNNASNRQRHLNYVHSDVKEYSCDLCSKCFKTDIERKSHTDHVHLKKPWPKRNKKRQIDGATGSA